MGLTVSAVWKNMQQEDYDNQPYLYNGDPAWGDLVIEILKDKWLSTQFFFSGLSPLLTCCTPEAKEHEIKWVKPQKLIQTAEKLQKRLNNNSKLIKTILTLYSKHAAGIKSPQEELSGALDSIIEVSEFVESKGATLMSFQMEW